MKRLARTIARPGAVVVATWAAAWLYWSVSRRAPTPGALVVAGIALPALVLLSIGGLRRAFRGPDRPTVVPPAASASATTANRRAPGNSIALLGASLCLPAGDTPETVTAAARRGMMPKLHSTLMRSDGSRVLACDVRSLSPADFAPGSLDAEAAARLNVTHRRALLLSANVLEKLFAHVEKMGDAGIQKGSSEHAKPQVAAELHLLLPERWRDEASTLAAWLQAQVFDTPRPIHITRLHVHLLSAPREALAVLDGLNTALNATHSLARHVVLACDSRVAQADVNELERTGALHDHGRPDGQIPTEGACALLVAAPDHVASESNGVIAPPPQLHRLLTTEAPRGGESDSSAATSVEANANLTDLLVRAHIETVPDGTQSNPCALVSDAGSHSQRRLDMSSAAESAWPDQAAPAHLDHLGIANGNSSAALTLSTIAVAGALAVETRRPVLAISTASPGSYAVVPVSSPQTIATRALDSAETAEAVI